MPRPVHESGCPQARSPLRVTGATFGDNNPVAILQPAADGHHSSVAFRPRTAFGRRARRCARPGGRLLPLAPRRGSRAGSGGAGRLTAIAPAASRWTEPAAPCRSSLVAGRRSCRDQSAPHRPAGRPPQPGLPRRRGRAVDAAPAALSLALALPGAADMPVSDALASNRRRFEFHQVRSGAPASTVSPGRARRRTTCPENGARTTDRAIRRRASTSCASERRASASAACASCSARVTAKLLARARSRFAAPWSTQPRQRPSPPSAPRPAAPAPGRRQRLPRGLDLLLPLFNRLWMAASCARRESSRRWLSVARAR